MSHIRHLFSCKDSVYTQVRMNDDSLDQLYADLDDVNQSPQKSLLPPALLNGLYCCYINFNYI